MEGNTHPQNNPVLHGSGYETQDLSVKGIVIFLIILIAGIVCVHIGMRLALTALTASAQRQDQQMLREEVVPSVAETRPYFPPPREQISPQRDLAALRAQEDAELNSYGWVNRKSGVVRIPIERAMELMAQRGVPPTWTSNGTAGPSSLQLQQQRPIQSTPPRKEEGKQ